jgi:phage-related protein
MWDGLDAMFSGWPSKLLELGSSLIARLAEGLGLNGEGVVGALTGVFGGAWTYLKGAWDLIAGLFTGDGDRMRQGLSKMWDGLDAMFSGWPSKLLELGSSLIARLAEGLGLNGEGVVGALSGVFGGAWTYLKGVWDMIAGLFTGDGDRIRQGLSKMWDGLDAMFSGWPSKLLELGVSLITRLTEGLGLNTGGIVAALTGVIGGAWTYLKGAWDLIAGLFTGNGERMRQGLIQMWDGMKAILDGWPTRLMQAGVDMITSLIDGIRSKIGAAVKVISDVGGGVVKSFKGWFDSPSSPRVPTQPRTKVPLVDPQSARPGSSGASRGLLFRNNKMASAGAGAAMALAAGTAPVAAFDGGTAVIAPAARAAPVAASSDNYVINVHPSAGMDEKALAREVGRQIEEISRRNAARQRSNLHD